MSFVGVLIRASLHYGDIGLVTGQRREPLREFVVAAGAGLIRKPSLFGHTESNAEKDAAFGGDGGSCFHSRSETAKADRFQRRQRDQRTGPT